MCVFETKVRDLFSLSPPAACGQIQTVHKSGGVVIEAVEVDFWWRRPETMELRNGETGQVWGKVDFFRLSLHVPWNGGFAQVRDRDVNGDATALFVHKANILSDETVFGVSLSLFLSLDVRERVCVCASVIVIVCECVYE